MNNTDKNTDPTELPMYRAKSPSWLRPGDELFLAYLPPNAMYDSDWLNIAKCAMKRRAMSVPNDQLMDREHQSVVCCVSRINVDPDRFARARP